MFAASHECPPKRGAEVLNAAKCCFMKADTRQSTGTAVLNTIK